jgi:transcription initiation factor TFIIB
MQTAAAEAAGIPEILGRLGVANPRIEWTASNIFLRARDYQSRGGPHTRVRAAAVYASCRVLGVPRTLKDVSAATGVRASDIARSYRKMLLDVDLKVTIPDPTSFVPGIARRAGIDFAVERRAVEILSKLMHAEVSAGKAPAVVAAASLHVAYSELHPAWPRAGGEPTLKIIAGAAAVSEVSVRNQSDRIRSTLGLSERGASQGVNTR